VFGIAVSRRSVDIGAGVSKPVSAEHDPVRWCAADPKSTVLGNAGVGSPSVTVTEAHFDRENTKTLAQTRMRQSVFLVSFPGSLPVEL